jgi:uroporphyrinogen-III synthase
VPDLLILRPQPGADATAARAREMGLDARIAPLFAVLPLDWEPPDPAEVEATLITSGNAARNAGPAIESFIDLPCYTVGEATAAAAREAGFTQVKTGPSDGAALLELAAADGVTRALHLCGRDRLIMAHSQLELVQRAVYAAEAASSLPPEAAEAVGEGALALIHSPRAGETFAALVDAAGLERRTIAIAAISPAALAAAGGGWELADSAPAPRDEALLELAAKLCQTRPRSRSGNRE